MSDIPVLSTEEDALSNGYEIYMAQLLEWVGFAYYFCTLIYALYFYENNKNSYWGVLSRILERPVTAKRELK